MGWFTKDVETMDDPFVHTLQDICYAENQIRKSLPDMVEKATNPELKQGYPSHLQQTEGHIDRLQQVFKQHGAEEKGVTCPESQNGGQAHKGRSEAHRSEGG